MTKKHCTWYQVPGTVRPLRIQVGLPDTLSCNQKLLWYIYIISYEAFPSRHPTLTCASPISYSSQHLDWSVHNRSTITMMASNTSNGSRGGEGSWLPQWLFERPSFTFISLQEELNALPQEERIRAHRDRSGEEDEDIDDSPEFFQMKIHAMDEAIDAIEEKEAYETAVFVNPTYVESDAFRLAFLRAEGFDAVTAAKRMVRYWERKVELFGTENAFKPSVTIMHLKEEDYPALAKAGINVLPLVDASGRGMIYSALSEWEPNINSMVRIAK